MEKQVYVVSIDEEFEKARVKGFLRTRKGKLERVKEFERKGEKVETLDTKKVRNVIKQETEKVGASILASYTDTGKGVKKVKVEFKPDFLGGKNDSKIYKKLASVTDKIKEAGVDVVKDYWDEGRRGILFYSVTFKDKKPGAVREYERKRGEKKEKERQAKERFTQMRDFMDKKGFKVLEDKNYVKEYKVGNKRVRVWSFGGWDLYVKEKADEGVSGKDLLSLKKFVSLQKYKHDKEYGGITFTPGLSDKVMRSKIKRDKSFAKKVFENQHDYSKDMVRLAKDVLYR